MPDSNIDIDRLCEPRATAVHVNSGRRWTVTEVLPGGGYLIIVSPTGFENKISREAWHTQPGSDVAGVRCHSLLGCGPPVAEAETEKGWLPVCDRCMETAWEQGLRVRKLQVPAA